MKNNEILEIKKGLERLKKKLEITQIHKDLKEQEQEDKPQSQENKIEKQKLSLAEETPSKNVIVLKRKDVKNILISGVGLVLLGIGVFSFLKKYKKNK
jgi:hypothetical protein